MPRLAANPEGIRYEEQRRFAIPLADAWRLLADTDHLNRAIGLPAVEFSPLEGGELVRKARARAYGVVPLRWREFPFDWIRERRYAVRREFESGPLDWIVCGIELEPEGAETTLTSWALFRPRNAAGRVLWRLGRAPVHGLLEFCERYLARQAAGETDPVPVPKGRPKVDRALLDRLLDEMAGARELRSLLRERVLEASDDQVTKVRPYALAAVWGQDRREVLELVLHAARAGLFEPRWQLMCPSCRIPKSEVAELHDLPPQFHCDPCGIVYTVAVERHLELRFSVAEAVRPTQDDIYCIGGPLRMPHVVAQQYLAPHEDRPVELRLGEALQLRTIGGAEHLDLVPGAPSRPSEVRLTYTAGRWTGPHSLEEEGRLSVPEGAALVLRNQTDGFVLALVETTERTRDATTLADLDGLDEFRDVLDPDAIARAAGR
jgi:hypothetical protein